MFNLVGDYRYSGCIIDGQKYSVVHNGDEILRVSKCFDYRRSQRIWTSPEPTTLEVREVIRLSL